MTPPSKNKRKTSRNAVPDRQLAQAFGFTMDDLSANRAGYLSLAQQWGIPLALRRTFGLIADWLPVSPALPVASVCGRVALERQQYLVMSFYHAETIEKHKLMIADNQLVFHVTPQQYRLIAEGVPYWVYYTPADVVIMSLERAEVGCG